MLRVTHLKTHVNFKDRDAEVKVEDQVVSVHSILILRKSTNEEIYKQILNSRKNINKYDSYNIVFLKPWVPFGMTNKV